MPAFPPNPLIVSSDSIYSIPLLLHNMPSTQQTMQHYFNQQICCDMTIEILVPQVDAEAGDETANQSGRSTKKRKVAAKDKKVQIKAHRLALGARSTYFK